MASKSRSKKEPGNKRSGDAADKDLVSELKKRVAFLENELRLNHDRTILDAIECKPAIEKLEERERFLSNVFECIQDGISVLDKDLNIIQVNPVMEKRYSRNIAGKKCYQAYHGRSDPCELCPSVRAIKTGSAQTEVVFDLNGWSEIYAFPLVNDEGKVTGVIEHVRDINERMRTDKEREIAVEFLSLVNEATSTSELIRKTATFFQQRSGCEAVGIRLREGDDYPYYEARGFRPEFIRKENLLCDRDSQGRVLRDKDGFPMLECMCGNVITGRFDPSQPFFTAKGSFWTNSTTELLATTSEKDRMAKTRNTCNTEGYESFALIALRAGEERLGVLQLNDRRKGHFTLEEITMWERLADYLAVALAKFVAEDALKDAKTQAELYLDLMGHDINNMHQIALGYLELARDVNPVAGQSELLDRPIEVLQRGAQLIQNVRKLRKLKDGVFQTQEVDVCKVLEDVQREFGAVPHKSITLNTNGREHCLVLANELLHDVFANLVSNAIKHTGDRADIVIDMDVIKENGRDYCRVMVEDNGPGIPDDFKGKIFNRMLRGTTKAKGMGLGLYLVKLLMESYGGRVWVEDRIVGDYTKGARFVVMQPTIEK